MRLEFVVDVAFGVEDSSLFGAFRTVFA